MLLSGVFFVVVLEIGGVNVVVSKFLCQNGGFVVAT